MNHDAVLIPKNELEWIGNEVFSLRTERDNLRAALAAATRADSEVRAELTRYKRAHKSTCHGCELCIPGSDRERNRERDDLDLDSAGRPLKAGT